MARTVEMWSLVLAGSLLAGAGCSREEASTTDAAASASAPPVAPATPDLAGYVVTYPTMEPQPGRRRLLQQFAVHQAADATSKEIAKLESGASVDLKASYQDWMLVAFQSGGQPTLGWIALKASDSRATTATEAEAPAATPAPRTGDAGAPTSATGADAGATGTGSGAGAGTGAGAATGAGADAGTTGTGAGADAGATGTGASADAGTGTGADAGAADAGTGRRKIELKKPLELKK
ncbi:hypothetical protein [Sorangium sp. So ce1097]|uniref:hypothetical protein n=1 Tax=Sorangium sp. So ce1097 TaxID=3133330 RepID=UPI003F5DD69D